MKKLSKRTGTVVGIIVLVLAAGLIAGIIIYNKAFDNFMLGQYPLLYNEYVEKYSQEYDIDKYIIYAVIKTESDFDPNAVSETDARGLMQLMETTFDWVKFRLDDGDDIVYENIFDPELNIKYGTYLMKYLMDRFGCLETAAAAYFSGVGTVSEWVADSRYSSDGIHLDEIPSKGAAHYVNKIKTAYDAYIKLYANERKG